MQSVFHIINMCVGVVKFGDLIVDTLFKSVGNELTAVSTVIPVMAVVVESFSLVVVVVKSAVLVVDILVDSAEVVLHSANQCYQILHPVSMAGSTA